VAGVCRSEPRSIDIQITNVPEKPTIQGNLGYCLGDDIILSTDEVLGTPDYIWNTPQGQRFTEVPELIIPDVAIEDAGRYSVAIQAGNCRSEESDGLSITVDNLVFEPVISSNSPLCPGDTLKLISTSLSGVTYSWSGPNGFSSNEQNPIIPNADENFNGMYGLTVSQGACSIMANDLMIEIVSDVGAPMINVENQSFCGVTLPSQLDFCISPSSLVSGAEYVLYNALNIEIGRTTEDCVTFTEVEILEEGNNEFYIRIDQDGCLSPKSENIQIEIESPPIVDAQIDETNLVFCDGNAVGLTSSFGPPEVNIQWRAVSANLMIDNVGPRGAQISNLDIGENIVVLSYSTTLCPDFSSTEITLTRERASIIRDDSYQLTNYNTAFLNVFANDDLSENVTIDVLQQPESGSLVLDENGAIFNPDIRFAGTTSFTYQVCDLNCGNVCHEATVFLRIGDDGDCTSPTIFTPNGDGYNDFFVVPCLTSSTYTGNKLTIFNQWGVVVLEENNYQNDWQGTYNGEDLPVGTYFYVLNLGDGSEPIVGFLTLER